MKCPSIRQSLCASAAAVVIVWVNTMPSACYWWARTRASSLKQAGALCSHFHASGTQVNSSGRWPRVSSALQSRPPRRPVRSSPTLSPATTRSRFPTSCTTSWCTPKPPLNLRREHPQRHACALATAGTSIESCANCHYKFMFICFYSLPGSTRCSIGHL